MSKCVSSYGEFSEHDSTEGVCNWCGETELDYDDLRQALETIQELHKPVETYLPTYDQQGNPIFKGYPQCAGCGSYEDPCQTRKLADEALDD